MGRLVAPRTNTGETTIFVDIPSHKVKNSAFMAFPAEFSDPSLGFRKVSSSSTKIMDGANLRARLKVASINLLDSARKRPRDRPTHEAADGEGKIRIRYDNKKGNKKMQRHKDTSLALFFGLVLTTKPFAHNFGQFDGDKGRIGLLGNRLGQHSFPRSGWSIQ